MCEASKYKYISGLGIKTIKYLFKVAAHANFGG